MIKESEQCSKIIKTEFSRRLVMTNKDDEDFENSTKCWICKKEYEKGKVKVKDHYHITGKYKVSPHQECNLNLSLIKKIPVVFPNFQNYYSHIIFQEIGKSDFKINFIPKTIKKKYEL